MWVLVIVQSMLFFDTATSSFTGSTFHVSQLNETGFEARTFETEIECENALKAFAEGHPNIPFQSHWSVDEGSTATGEIKLEGMDQNQSGMFALDCFETN